MAQMFTGPGIKQWHNWTKPWLGQYEDWFTALDRTYGGLVFSHDKWTTDRAEWSDDAWCSFEG